jgi:hypothetical protein
MSTTTEPLLLPHMFTLVLLKIKCMLHVLLQQTLGWSEIRQHKMNHWYLRCSKNRNQTKLRLKVTHLRRKNLFAFILINQGMCSHSKRDGKPCSKLQKLDCLIWQTRWSSFIGSDDSQGHHRTLMRCSSSSHAASRRWRGVNHDNFGGCGSG